MAADVKVRESKSHCLHADLGADGPAAEAAHEHAEVAEEEDCGHGEQCAPQEAPRQAAGCCYMWKAVDCDRGKMSQCG